MKGLTIDGSSAVGSAGACCGLTVVLGIVYPLAMTGAAQALFHDNANGSIVQVNGKDVGSDLIGQAYTKPANRCRSGSRRRPSAGELRRHGERGVAVRAEQRGPADS